MLSEHWSNESSFTDWNLCIIFATAAYGAHLPNFNNDTVASIRLSDIIISVVWIPQPAWCINSGTDSETERQTQLTADRRERDEMVSSQRGCRMPVAALIVQLLLYNPETSADGTFPRVVWRTSLDALLYYTVYSWWLISDHWINEVIQCFGLILTLVDLD